MSTESDMPKNGQSEEEPPMTGQGDGCPPEATNGHVNGKANRRTYEPPLRIFGTLDDVLRASVKKDEEEAKG